MTTIHSKIVGTRFYTGAYERLRETRANSRLGLTREPDNEHDANAIAVEIKGQKIGHVPRDDAARLAPLLDSRTDVRAYLSGFNKLRIEVKESPPKPSGSRVDPGLDDALPEF